MIYNWNTLHQPINTKDKLYLTWTNKPITVSARSSIHYFTIDDKLRYISFFADFGPLNIAQVIKFCDLLNSKFKVNVYLYITVFKNIWYSWYFFCCIKRQVLLIKILYIQLIWFFFF